MATVARSQVLVNEMVVALEVGKANSGPRFASPSLVHAFLPPFPLQLPDLVRARCVFSLLRVELSSRSESPNLHPKLFLDLSIPLFSSLCSFFR